MHVQLRGVPLSVDSGKIAYNYSLPHLARTDALKIMREVEVRELEITSVASALEAPGTTCRLRRPPDESRVRDAHGKRR